MSPGLKSLLVQGMRVIPGGMKLAVWQAIFFKLVLNWEYLKRWRDQLLVLKCFSKVFEFWFIATWNYTISNFLLRTGRLKKKNNFDIGAVFCTFSLPIQVYKSLLLIQNNVKNYQMLIYTHVLLALMVFFDSILT